jgi:uncharacterized repeat protein (TIGR01451 family)
MTHLFKTFGWDKLNKLRDLGWRNLLVTAALFGSALPMVANAQATGCLANETAQTISFATPNWTAGSGGPIVYNGVTANVGNATATVSATLTDRVAGNPVTAQSGNFPDAFYYLVDRPGAAGTNTFTIAFNKPVRNLKITATDIDAATLAANGTDAYQDRVTVTGTSPTGAAVIPAGLAVDATKVSITGNVALSIGARAVGATNNDNCLAASNLCNATFTFAQPVASVALTYDNGPNASGNPPPQVVGIANIGFCVQNPDLSLVKDDAGASFTAGSTGTYSFAVSNAGSAPTSGTTTVKDILPAGMSFGTPLTPGGANAAAWTCVRSTTTNTNDTATCTSTTAIAAAGSSTFTLPVAVALNATGTLTNRAKVFGGGDPNKVAETTTGTIATCPSDSLAGAVANAGCGFETTPILSPATLIITKTDGKAITSSGGTNNYVVTLTNQGPSAANGVIVTDVVGAGLTCPATNVVTCTVTGAGAVCPAAPLTIASLTTGVTVATLPVNGALQFAYTCNVN